MEKKGPRQGPVWPELFIVHLGFSLCYLDFLHSLKNVFSGIFVKSETKLNITDFPLFRIGQPLCLSQLVHYFETGNPMPAWQAYLYATGVVMGSAIYVFTHHP